MNKKYRDLLNKDRFDMVSVRLSKGQIDILDKCCKLTGQNRTELIREAVSSYIYKLYNDLKVENK